MSIPIVWEDEVWDSRNGSYEPQYQLEDDRLVFLNDIIKPGTEHNQGNMNNLINPDNPDSFPECVKTVTFPTGKMLTEWRSKSTGVLIVSRTMEFATMTRTTIIYFSDGTEAQKRVVKTTFPVGQIKQEVSTT